MKVDSKSAKMLVCAAAAVMGLTVSAATPIVKDGKAVAAVRIDGSDHVQIAYAAQELTNWVAQLTGAAIPVDGAAKAKVEADGYFDAVVPFRRLVGL